MGSRPASYTNRIFQGEIMASIEQYETVVNAVQALAGVCDYAPSRDNMGYNGGDAEYGHSIANQTIGGRALSEAQQRGDQDDPEIPKATRDVRDRNPHNQGIRRRLRGWVPSPSPRVNRSSTSTGATIRQ